MQGDLLESCPVLVFKELTEPQETGSLLEILQGSAGLQTVRTILMTQACDLEYHHVRNVILCPIYALEEYKKLWEEGQLARNQNATPKNWKRFTEEVKEGKVWNLVMLQKREAPEGNSLSIPPQIVDFHEVFSLPRDFLEQWVRNSGLNRLRLCPPYREHLSQAFARFFMRVGLPQDIEL
jgi:hypothetical protein